MHLRTTILVLALIGLVASPALAWRAPVRQNHRVRQLRLPKQKTVRNKVRTNRSHRSRRSRVHASLRAFVRHALQTNPTMWAKAGSITGNGLSTTTLNKRVRTFKRLVVLQRVAINDKMLINAAAAKVGF